MSIEEVTVEEEEEEQRGGWGTPCSGTRIRMRRRPARNKVYS